MKILDEFVEYLRLEKKGGLAEKTIERYLLNLRYLFEKSDDPLTIQSYPEISKIIRELRKERRWGQSNTKHCADTYSVFYNWAFRYGYIKETPFRLGHEFKRKETIQIDFFDWDSEDFKKLVYNPNNSTRDNAILHTLRSSGLRAAELCNLKMKDVNLDKKIILVRCGKGGDDGLAMIDEEAKLWLSLYIPQIRLHSRLDWLFQDNQLKKQITPSILGKMLTRKGDKLGIHAYPQKMRKSLGSNLADRGASIPVIQHILRHKSSQTTTRHYIGFKQERLQEHYNKSMETPENKELTA